MKSILISILFIVTLNCSGFTQVFPLMPKYYKPLDSSVLANKSEEEEKKQQMLMQQHEKLTYTVAMGTGYTSFGSDISMMHSYIAPTIDYQVNSKLNFSVTGIVMQNNINGLEAFYGSEPGYAYNSNVSNYGITGSAYYQLNNKWSVWGDGAYLENQSIFNDYRANVYDDDFKTVSVGVGYKVSDKVHFNIEYSYSNGLNPSYHRNSSFYNSGINPYRSNYGIWGY